MTGVNFAAGKAFVISSTSGFVYVYDMKTLRPAGRIKIGTNIQLETATTDTADEKLYLADSTENAVVIIDAKTEAVREGRERGPVSVGHAHHGQQGQLLPLSWSRSGVDGWLRRRRSSPCHDDDREAPRLPARCASWPPSPRGAQGVREHTRLGRPAGTAVTRIAGGDAHADARAPRRVAPDPDLGPHRRHHRQDRTRSSTRIAVRARGGARQGRPARPRVSRRARSRRCTRRYVTRVAPRAGGVDVEAVACRRRAGRTRPHYVMEIVVERGPFLVGPERGDHRGRRHGTSSTCSSSPGSTCRRRSTPASRASCYTQVLDGLNDGDQVVTFGSFFIDSEHKLKGTDQGPAATSPMITAVIRAVIRWRVRRLAARRGRRRCSASTRSAPPRSTPSPTFPIRRSSST